VRGPEFLARARREADAARPVLVEDEDGAVVELEDATEGVEDHFARAESAVLELLRYDRSFRDAGHADRGRAELVVGRLFQSTAWSEHDERMRVADFEALDHDLRAAIGIAVRDASAQTTADDERDALGLAAETLERLAALV
jgi:hypothetical protein